MKRLTQIVGLAMACAFASGAAHADTLEKPGGFPERPLTIVVPYGTGGGSDTVARALAGPLSEVVDTEVRVINQPGAGGFAALPDYLSRPADGYAIFQHTNFVIEGEVVGRVDIDFLGNCIRFARRTRPTARSISAPTTNASATGNPLLPTPRKTPAISRSAT